MTAQMGRQTGILGTTGGVRNTAVGVMKHPVLRKSCRLVIWKLAKVGSNHTSLLAVFKQRLSVHHLTPLGSMEDANDSHSRRTDDIVHLHGLDD